MEEKSNKSLMTERVFRNTVKYLLFEAKIHKELDTFFNSKKTKNIIVNVDGNDVQYFLQPKIEQFLREKFSEPGSTLVGMDLAWIRKEVKSQAESGGVEPIEDWLDYIVMMRKEEIKRKLSRTDLNDYVDLNDLRSTIDAVTQLSDEEQAVFGNLMKDSRHIQMIAEFDDHEIYFPITVQGSIAFDTPRRTTWCTTKPAGQNLFYSYVARGENIVLYYILKKSLKESSAASSRVCLGFINNKLKLPSQAGTETVDLPNNGLSEKKLRSPAYFGDDYDAIIATCQSHIGTLKDGHPARAVVRRCCASIEYLKAQIKDYGKEEKEDFVELVKRASFYKSPPVLEYCFFYRSDQQGVDRRSYLQGIGGQYLEYDASNGYFPEFLSGIRPNQISISNLTQKGLDALDLNKFDLSNLRHINFYQHSGDGDGKGGAIINDTHLSPLTNLIRTGGLSKFNNIFVNITKSQSEGESYEFRAPDFLSSISEKYSDVEKEIMEKIVFQGMEPGSATLGVKTCNVEISGAHNFDANDGLSLEMLTRTNYDYFNAPDHIGKFVIRKRYERMAERDPNKYLEEIKKIISDAATQDYFAKDGYGIELIIQNCEIDKIPDITLIGDVFNSLHLQGCKNITSVPKFSGVNKNLIDLKIQGCSLSDSESLLNIKKAFPNLNSIDISQNPLERLPENCFYNQNTETNIRYDQTKRGSIPFDQIKNEKIVGSMFNLDLSCTKITELPDYIFYNEMTGESLIDSKNSEFSYDPDEFDDGSTYGYKSRVDKKPFYTESGLSIHNTKIKKLSKEISEAGSNEILNNKNMLADGDMFSFSEFEDVMTVNKITINEKQIQNMGGIENFLKNFKIAKEVKYSQNDFETWGLSNTFTLDGRTTLVEDEYEEYENVWDHEIGEWVEAEYVPLSELSIKSIESLFLRASKESSESVSNRIISNFLEGGIERINILNLKQISSDFLTVLMRYLIEHAASHISAIRIAGNNLNGGISGAISAINDCSVPIYSISIANANDNNGLNNIDANGVREMNLKKNNLTQFPIKTFENYYKKVFDLGAINTQWNINTFFDVSHNPISSIPDNFLMALLKYGYKLGSNPIPTIIAYTNIKAMDIAKKVLIPLYVSYVKNILKPEQYFFLSKVEMSEDHSFQGYEDDEEAVLHDGDTGNYGYFSRQISDIKDYMIDRCIDQDNAEKNLGDDISKMDTVDSSNHKRLVKLSGEDLYDEIINNFIIGNNPGNIYCVFHWRAVLVEIHLIYKKNGYNKTIEELRKELDKMAGKVDNDFLDEDEIMEIQKERSASQKEDASNIKDFYRFLRSFGEDSLFSPLYWGRYKNAYTEIYKKNQIGIGNSDGTSGVEGMITLFKHLVNRQITCLSLIRDLSMIDTYVLGINKDWEERQKNNLLSEYSKEELAGDDALKNIPIGDSAGADSVLELPLGASSFWKKELTFKSYLDAVVSIIKKAKNVMGVMRTSSTARAYAASVDNMLGNALRPAQVKGGGQGISDNESMKCVISDLDENVDSSNISEDSNFIWSMEYPSFFRLTEKVFNTYGFHSDADGITIMQPYDVNKYDFFGDVYEGLSGDDDSIFITLDLAEFLSDPSGKKYGIMHKGGRGIQ